MTDNVTGSTRIFDCAGKILDLSIPAVMGILNLTDNSFFDGGSYLTPDTQVRRVEKMILEGAAVIDIGAVSTRPGIRPVSAEEEKKRLMPALENLVSHFPDVIFSIDTFRPEVASAAYDQGAGMINDIYGGCYDPQMIPFVITKNLPYILMHMQGDPENMQKDPEYKDVVGEILFFFREQLKKFPSDFHKIILDPGFGFGKTVAHNYRMLAEFDRFLEPGFPVLSALSRKSMINHVLKTTPAGALNGTTVLNTISLLKGASMLRVHDVKEAMEAVRLVSMLKD